MYRTIKKMFAFALVALMASGCVTQKRLMYLQDADLSTVDSINAKFTPQSETIIRIGDAMTISVSALDKEAVTPYNLPTVVYDVPGSHAVQSTAMLQYYIVDEAGDIELPVLGKVHVAGLKRTEVEQTVKELLLNQIIDPMVHVNLINAKVSVLGEVNRPGQVAMTTDRLTILEALAAAGDMTPYGMRENVLITREVNGKLEFARLDLRRTDICTSPYYYLQQNDVIYVAPNKVRAVSSTNTSIWLSMISTALSAVTVIVTVVRK